MTVNIKVAMNKGDGETGQTREDNMQQKVVSQSRSHNTAATWCAHLGLWSSCTQIYICIYIEGAFYVCFMQLPDLREAHDLFSVFLLCF